jgi:hypothetical protein
MGPHWKSRFKRRAAFKVRSAEEDNEMADTARQPSMSVFNAFNRHDLDKIMELLAEDACRDIRDKGLASRFRDNR